MLASEQGPAAVKVKYPYTRTYKTQHGEIVTYFRRNGRNKRLLAAPGTTGFQNEYDEAKAWFEGGRPAEASPPSARPSAGTLRWLCVEYFGSSEFKQLAGSTQAARRSVLESVLLEPLTPDSQLVFADCPLRSITPKHVKVLRDRKYEYPEAANIRIKVLRGVFKWALESEKGGIISNPARDVPKLKIEGGGYHAWTEQERERFENRWPIGTKARLAYALLFHTGQRRSDVVLFGRQHVHHGRLRFTQVKNRRRKPVSLEIPILPELQNVIDASPVGDLTFLVNDHGKPFAVAGFGNKFREWCNEAGLPKHCSAHGLRKAAATVAAENGATAHELMAIFGWLSLKEAERYTRSAERKKLADRGMGRLVPIKPGT